MWKNETITYTYIYPLAEIKRGIEIFIFPQWSVQLHTAQLRKMNDIPGLIKKCSVKSTFST